MGNQLARDVAAFAERNLPTTTFCEGCGTSQVDAINEILAGKAACCPECSTLDVQARNHLRAIGAAAGALATAADKLGRCSSADNGRQGHVDHCARCKVKTAANA